MRCVRFRDPGGMVRHGEWHDDAVSFAGDRYDLDEVDVLPPCEPTKIVCVGRNYAAHAAELDNEVPDRPSLFLKPPSALAAHGDRLRLPAADRVDHECELAVVIGSQCRSVDESEAMDVVAGFTCMNDLSNRDDQEREQNWVRGKAFDGAAPLGPAVVDPHHVPSDAAVRTWVNSDRRQDGSRDRLLFDVPTLVAEITTHMTLEPGDVVSTGTPAGVAPLAPGDRVAVEVEGVGRLVNEVRAP